MCKAGVSFADTLIAPLGVVGRRPIFHKDISEAREILTFLLTFA